MKSAFVQRLGSTKLISGALFAVLGIGAGAFSLTSLQGDLGGKPGQSPHADLSVQAVSSLEFVKPNTEARLTIIVKNVGPSRTKKVELTASTDASVRILSAGLEKNCKLKDKNIGAKIECSIGTLEAGGERTVVLPILVTSEAACDSLAVTNLVVSGEEKDPQIDNNSLSNGISVRCEAAADLQTTTVADVLKTSPSGRLVQYTITVKNNGPDTTVSDATLLLQKQTDDAQDLRLYTGDVTPGCNGEQCSVPSGLARGASTTVSFIGYFPNAPEDCGKQSVTRVMLITSGQMPDPVSSNNDSSVGVSVDCSTAADVSVDIHAAKDKVPRNERVNFTVTAKNAGPDTAENLLIINRAAGGTSFVFSELDEHCRQFGTSADVICSFDVLQPNQTMTIELPVVVSENANCAADLNSETDARAAVWDKENTDNNHAQAMIHCE